MVEHQNHNLLVEGSSPPLATIKTSANAEVFCFSDAALQAFERRDAVFQRGVRREERGVLA